MPDSHNKPLSLNDVFSEARRLSVVSSRLRAFLGLLERHQDKPMGLSHPVHKLATLVADVKASLPPPVPEPGSYSEALRGLVDKPFCGSGRYRSQQHRAVRLGADPDLLAFERAFVKRMRRLGVPMFSECVVRDQATQARLYVVGHSRATFGKSPHNFGMAADVVHGTRGRDLSRAAWDIIGHVGKECAYQVGVPMVWGGDWKVFDPAHWELMGWRSRAIGRPPL